MSENVKVAVRCRPMSQKEIDQGEPCCVEISEERATVAIRKIDSESKDQDNEKRYTFDYAYFTEATNEQLYTDIGEPIVTKAIDGFNGTVFAYGQTGSGKTYTMMGGEDDYASGIIPRLTTELFASLGRLRAETPGTQFQVTVSYLEIYNEEVKDLLNPRDAKLKIREHTKYGFYVDALAELVVGSGPQVLDMLRQGSTIRQVAATKMNSRSSRSHSVFTIKLAQKTVENFEGTEKITELNAKINLVDLAGSERAAKTGAAGARLREGANINRSLMALGNVIGALARRAGAAAAEGGKPGGGGGRLEHVPYRDSTLTKLLQDSLGGNGVTIMVAAISPAAYNFDESVSTLRYADRAKQIKNKLVKNEDVTQRVIRELKDEIERLRKLKESGGAGGGGGEEKEDGDDGLAKKLEELEEAKRNDWAERERLTRALEEERQRNLNQEISSILKDIKTDKKNAMAKIKELDEEKKKLESQLRKNKRRMKSKKKDLEELMERFEVVHKQVSSSEQQDGQEADAELEKQEAQLFQEVEEQSKKIDELKSLEKEMKEKLQDIENKLVEERTGLVAFQNVLNQNERLREKIRAEQMAKLEQLGAEAKEETQKMLEEKLHMDEEKIEKKMRAKIDSLRTQMQGEAQGKEAVLKEKIDILRKENKALELEKEELRQKITDWEDKTAEAEVTSEELEYEVEDMENDITAVEEQLKELKRKKQEEISALKKEKQALEENIEKKIEERSSQIQKMNKKMHEEERFKVFQQLLAFFEGERARGADACREAARLLGDSARDLAHLARKNQELRQKLHAAKTWEPDIS